VLEHRCSQRLGGRAIEVHADAGPEAVQAYRRGRTRFTFTFTLDLHAEMTFNVGRTTVAGIAEVFNVLNTHNEVEEDVVTRPSFRTPTAVQPPLAGRLAIRVGF